MTFEEQKKEEEKAGGWPKAIEKEISEAQSDALRTVVATLRGSPSPSPGRSRPNEDAGGPAALVGGSGKGTSASVGKPAADAGGSSPAPLAGEAKQKGKAKKGKGKEKKGKEKPPPS